MHIQDEYNIPKNIENWGSDGSTVETTLDSHWKSVDSWVGTIDWLIDV
jgi:hypothetical protein